MGDGVSAPPCTPVARRAEGDTVSTHPHNTPPTAQHSHPASHPAVTAARRWSGPDCRRSVVCVCVQCGVHVCVCVCVPARTKFPVRSRGLGRGFWGGKGQGCPGTASTRGVPLVGGTCAAAARTPARETLIHHGHTSAGRRHTCRHRDDATLRQRPMFPRGPYVGEWKLGVAWSPVTDEPEGTLVGVDGSSCCDGGGIHDGDASLEFGDKRGEAL